MFERCDKCGAELFTGQQFCRRCGERVGDAAAGEDAPTQLFPAGRPTSEPGDETAPFAGGRATDPVYEPRPTAYPSPLASQHQTSSLGAEAPPRRRRGRAFWFLSTLALLAVAVVGGLAMLAWNRPERVVYIRKGGDGVRVGDGPVAPPPPEHSSEAGEMGVAVPVDETGARVSGGETVIVKRFEMGEGASFSVKSVNGRVALESWDGPTAEVKIIKRGNPQARSGAHVMLERKEQGLALASVTPPGGDVTIAYEIRLPRTVREVEVSSDKGDVRVSNLDGDLVLSTRLGGVELRDVTGKVRASILKGDAKVVYSERPRRDAQEFSVVRGNVEVAFDDSAAAQIKAETMDGDIRIDDSLGLKVEKRAIGRFAAGRVGEGGEPLLLKVVNGDIKLKK